VLKWKASIFEQFLDILTLISVNSAWAGRKVAIYTLSLHWAKCPGQVSILFSIWFSETIQLDIKEVVCV